MMSVCCLVACRFRSNCKKLLVKIIFIIEEKNMKAIFKSKKLLVGLVSSVLSAGALAKDITLLNVSYDPTRELYAEYNAAFSKYW